MSEQSKGRATLAQSVEQRSCKPQASVRVREVASVSSQSKGRASMILIERRAEFVYEGARIAAMAARAPIVPAPWGEREQAFRDQFLKVIERQCGDQRSRSPEELHGSWMQAYFSMGWVYGTEYSREKKTHPDLVPYADLGQLERDKDSVFVALCDIARKWVYDPPNIPISVKEAAEATVAARDMLEKAEAVVVAAREIWEKTARAGLDKEARK